MGEDEDYELVKRLYGEKTANECIGKIKRGSKMIDIIMDTLLSGQDGFLGLDDKFDSYLPRDAIRFDPSKVNAAESLA